MEELTSKLLPRLFRPHTCASVLSVSRKPQSIRRNCSLRLLIQLFSRFAPTTAVVIILCKPLILYRERNSLLKTLRRACRDLSHLPIEKVHVPPSPSTYLCVVGDVLSDGAFDLACCFLYIQLAVALLAAGRLAKLRRAVIEATTDGNVLRPPYTLRQVPVEETFTCLAICSMRSRGEAGV